MMGTYDQPDLGDNDFELARELLGRCKPLVEGSPQPQWRYLTEARGLPEHAIRYSAANLRALEPPIPGFDQLAYGIVSLLHNGTVAAPVGLAIEACGPAGERVLDGAGRTARKSFCLVPHGVRDGLFQVKATGAQPMIAYMVEGRLAKAIAIAALFDDPAIYGWGGRGSLGAHAPAELTVVVIEDARPADEAEVAAHDLQMERGCDRLILAGKLVRRTGGPPCGCCKDVDEALAKHPLQELRAWINSAVPVELSLDGHARKCAKIKDPLRRGKAIADVIEQFGLRRQGLTKAFRDQVAQYAGDLDREDSDVKPEQPPVEDTLPWPHPVNGADVLDAIVEVVQRHVHLPREAAYATALWCAHSHALDLAWFNPRLAICSPVKRCGKTTLIEVLTGLVARPKPTSGVTPSVVFRMIDKWHPTYLIDEADGYLPNNEELRSVLNSGHVRTSAFVDRTENTADGTREPRSFSTWTPLVVAGIGRLPSTLDDRSIKIRLQRKPRTLRLTRFRADRIARITELGRMLARFVADNRIAIEKADVEPPQELHDRAADNWRPLLAIAQAAGGHWPERAWKTALVLEDVEQAAEDLCVELLADIRAIFNSQRDPLKRQTLFSAELLSALLAMPERPWPEAGRNERPLTARGMANLLKPFGLRTSKNVRRGRQQAKGFERSEFDDAFFSYLPPLEPSQPSQRPNQGNPPVSDDSDLSPGTDQPSHGTDANGSKPAEMLDWDAARAGTASGPPSEKTSRGNGVDRVDVTCAYCSMPFLAGDEPVEINGKIYHSDDACAGTIRRRQTASTSPPLAPPVAKKPKGKRNRIKGADTTPGVEGL
jgi:hypothetical protein